MASANYTNLCRDLALADVDYSSASFKMLLHSSVPSESNLDTWVDRADVSNEIAATGGYSTGGFAVTATVNALSTASNKQTVTFAASNPVIGAFTGVFLAGSIYLSTGVAANDLLLHMIDFGGTITGGGGPLAVTFTNDFEIQR